MDFGKYQSDSVEHFFEGEKSSTESDHRKVRPTWTDIILRELDWQSTLQMTLVHVLAVWGAYRAIAHWQTISCWTIALTYLIAFFSGIGALAGSHRMWSHRSFKAHWPLKLFLLLCQTVSGQRSVVRWAREHRTHHKYSGTDADCVNINRGFFFAHIGWVLIKPHPECAKRMRECNVDDLLNDPMVRFQYDYYEPLMIVFNVLLPTLMPYIFFGEGLLDSFLCVFALRYVYTLHIAFSGNSFLHMHGTKPYDKRSSATHCTWMIFATLGAGYHNYHHAFPYDYAASEFGPSWNFNVNTVLIDACAKLGLAYDLKRASPETIAHWKNKFGDPLEAIPQRSVLLDWICGFFFSALPIWLILLGRFIVYSIQKQIVYN